jgi:hypothetical protein
MAQHERFPYSGAIDADDHILEPPETWERHIDPQFRDRANRIRADRDGLEMLEIGGHLAKYRRPGQLAQCGAMGHDPQKLKPSPDKTSVNQAPFGSMDPKERLALLDRLRSTVSEKAVPALGTRDPGRGPSLVWELEHGGVLHCRAR